MNARGTPVRVGNRVVGDVRAGVFHKRAKASVHMLRSPKAWALDCRSLVDAQQAGAAAVAIHDTESGRTFTASIEVIWRDGFPVSRGCGQQIGLGIDHWAVTYRSTVAVQIALF